MEPVIILHVKTTEIFVSVDSFCLLCFAFSSCRCSATFDEMHKMIIKQDFGCLTIDKVLVFDDYMESPVDATIK